MKSLKTLDILLTDYIEATDGCSELIIVVGAVASSETLDRHIMKVSTQCKIHGLALQQIYHQILRSRALQTHEAGISVYFCCNLLSHFAPKECCVLRRSRHREQQQTGIGFVVLRGGHKKCSTVNRTYLARATRRCLALDDLYAT